MFPRRTLVLILVIASLLGTAIGVCSASNYSEFTPQDRLPGAEVDPLLTHLTSSSIAEQLRVQPQPLPRTAIDTRFTRALGVIRHAISTTRVSFKQLACAEVGAFCPTFLGRGGTASQNWNGEALAGQLSPARRYLPRSGRLFGRLRWMAMLAVLETCGIIVLAGAVLTMKELLRRKDELLAEACRAAQGPWHELSVLGRELQSLQYGLKVARTENSAAKEALATVSVERDALKAREERLEFERNNYKDTLADAIKRSQRGKEVSSDRFLEEIGKPFSLIEAQWRLRQTLQDVESERDDMSARVARATAQLHETERALKKAEDALCLEKQTAHGLLVERDSYAKFSKLGSAQKRALMDTLAIATKHQERQRKRLANQSYKLDRLLRSFINDANECHIAQKRLAHALNRTLSRGHTAVHLLLSGAPNGPSWFADLGLVSGLQECSTMAQQMIAEVDTQRAATDHYLHGLTEISNAIGRRYRNES